MRLPSNAAIHCRLFCLQLLSDAACLRLSESVTLLITQKFIFREQKLTISLSVCELSLALRWKFRREITTCRRKGRRKIRRKSRLFLSFAGSLPSSFARSSIGLPCVESTKTMLILFTQFTEECISTGWYLNREASWQSPPRVSHFNCSLKLVLWNKEAAKWVALTTVSRPTVKRTHNEPRDLVICFSNSPNWILPKFEVQIEFF